MSPRPCARRVLGTAVLAVASVLAGCGETERPLDVVFAELSSTDSAVVDAAVVELGRRARNDPALVARLVRALEEDRLDPESSELGFEVDLSRTPEDRRVEAPAEVARVFQNRLAAHGIPARLLEATATGRIRVLLHRPRRPEDEAALLERTLALLRQPGVVELLAVVPRPGSGAGPRWDGDAASYDAYVAEAGSRWKPPEAVEPAGEEAPATWRVAPAAGPGQAPRWLVLRESEPGRRFDERSFVLVADTQPDRPLRLLVRVSPDRQEAFAAWTSGLAGADVALLVDGRVVATGKVPGETRDALPLPVATAEEAAAVVRAAEGGRLRWRVDGKVVPGAPAVDGPFSRALAGAGPIADEPLAVVERAGGPAAPAARWAREEILKQRTRTGR